MSLSTNTSSRPLRVVICWNAISGYLAACWRELSNRPGVDLRVLTFMEGATNNAPFNQDMLKGLNCQVMDRAHWTDADYVAGLASAHQPDVVAVCGWLCPAFLGLPFHASLQGARFCMGMDTNRKDTWRQTFARLKIGKFLDRLDRVFVAGERSWQFAKKLRVPESKIRRGVYAYDQRLFGDGYERRKRLTGGWPRRFLYVGRYIREKGIDTLLAGYSSYRRQATDPWPLTCCGMGAMVDQVRAAEGVQDLGFVQPEAQPEVYATHGVFVIASRYEPWGVVLAEAAGSGLPVICTESCGASVEIVRSFHNGLTVATDDADQLAAAFLWMDRNAARLPEMGLEAMHLARAFGADVWAEKWESAMRELIE
jgi:glycosyltransferase involved in cell wall biosynthesis